MEKPTVYPFVLYQAVELGFNFENESIQGVTTLWLGFKEAISVGSVFALHCRQCHIVEVLLNGIECDFVHNDPLRHLTFDRHTRNKYLGEELDVNYRAGLEICRVGELCLRIPNNMPAKMDRPKPLPMGVPRDVVMRFDKLMKIHENLGPQEEKRRSNMDGITIFVLFSSLSSHFHRNHFSLAHHRHFYSLNLQMCNCC